MHGDIREHSMARLPLLWLQERPYTTAPPTPMEQPATSTPPSDPASGKRAEQSAPSPEQEKQEEQVPALWETWWATLYFLYWKETKSFRRALKTSVFILIVLALGSLLEVALGALEILPDVEKWLHKVLANGLVLTLLVLAIFIVSLHHFREWRRPEYESAFVKSLFDFAASYPVALRSGKRMTLVEALERFYPIFERAHVHHLAVFLEHDGSLSVNPEHVHPRHESPEEYYPVLPVGKGVAGRVYKDSCTRYMPRCFLFGKAFKHSLRYSIARGGNLSEEVPDFGAYRVLGQKSLYQSLLCVPLSNPVENRNCSGVLNISFKKRATLDRIDITMAMVVGLVLGQAMPYLDMDAR